MPIEAVALAPLLSKLIGFGISTWTAHEKQGLGTDDLKAVQSLIDLGAGVAGLPKSDQRIGALHFILVTRAFGEALKRHWYGDEHFAPGVGWWAKVKSDEVGRARMAQIEERMRIAAPKPKEVGALPADEDLGVVSSLIGNPLSTPYYRRLWSVFTDSSLQKAGEEPLVLPDRRLQFERHFRLAYAEALASPRGEEIRRYLVSLEDRRAELVGELLIRDMAGWGSRHVFGNVAEHAELPPMPLGGMYVEPDAGNEKLQAEPVLGLLEKLIQSHPVVVLQADFGHGKSLTARMLAWSKARAYLAEAKPAPELWRPVFVKCAEDFESHSDDIEKVIRRAQWRQARVLKLDLALGDRAFELPAQDDGRTLFLIDGFDEVALGDQEVKGFFRRVQEQASATRRFVIFTRPAALRHGDHLKGIPVLNLLPLRTVNPDNTPGGQVDEWLKRWSCFNDRSPVLGAKDLAGRDLLEIAKTPILLFMIAHTWDAQAVAKPSLGDIYEGFFRQIARGKHEKDLDQNAQIAEASKQLSERLVSLKHLPSKADPPDAMLWLMGRVAWKAKCLEDAEWLEGHKQTLDDHEVREILRTELRLVDDAKVEHTIRVGLLLALQANLEEGTPRILFGHKSFREFLVGRYWASRLRRLIQDDDRAWETRVGEPLLEGRLLGAQDRSFDFFCEQVARWKESERRKLARWAQRCFDDERTAAETIRLDRRTLLREAALAIGSFVGKEGMNVAEELKLRAFMAWFWAMDVFPIVRAPKLQSPMARLRMANLRSADLREADLRGSNLIEADLIESDLREANLNEAIMNSAFLYNADLRGVDLAKSHLRQAKLAGADMSGANLSHAELGEAILRRTDLRRANVGSADLSQADLDEANLREATLAGADLRFASLKSADLRSADLRSADLRSADLRSADLRGARLNGADLRGAALSGANYEPDQLVEALTDDTTKR